MIGNYESQWDREGLNKETGKGMRALAAKMDVSEGPETEFPLRYPRVQGLGFNDKGYGFMFRVYN